MELFSGILGKNYAQIDTQIINEWMKQHTDAQKRWQEFFASVEQARFFQQGTVQQISSTLYRDAHYWISFIVERIK